MGESDGEHGPTSQTEVGRIALSKPWDVDPIGLGKSYFGTMDFRTFRMANGDVAICETNPNHEAGKTILLFENPTRKGFTSVYSPMTSQVLRTVIDNVFNPELNPKLGKGFLEKRSAARIRNQFLDRLGLKESVA